MPVQRSRDPMRITIVERAAASAALGCPPWGLGLCAGCGQLMRRYGRNAAMYCNVPARSSMAARAFDGLGGAGRRCHAFALSDTARWAMSTTCQPSGSGVAGCTQGGSGAEHEPSEARGHCPWPSQ